LQPDYGTAPDHPTATVPKNKITRSELLAAVGAGIVTIGVKVMNAYSEIANDSEETVREQVKEALPVLIAFTTYMQRKSLCDLGTL